MEKRHFGNYLDYDLNQKLSEREISTLIANARKFAEDVTRDHLAEVAFEIEAPRSEREKVRDFEITV